MKLNQFSKLIISLFLNYGSGFLGSAFTISEIPDWYSKLNKPTFNPPNWVFGPVWTTLYTFMGISLFLVWKNGLADPKVKFAFWFFIAHLFVNFLRSFVFFGSKNLTSLWGHHRSMAYDRNFYLSFLEN